jgi:hypothetical protein
MKKENDLQLLVSQKCSAMIDSSKNGSYDSLVTFGVGPCIVLIVRCEGIVSLSHLDSINISSSNLDDHILEIKKNIFKLYKKSISDIENKVQVDIVQGSSCHSKNQEMDFGDDELSKQLKELYKAMPNDVEKLKNALAKANFKISSEYICDNESLSVRVDGGATKIAKDEDEDFINQSTLDMKTLKSKHKSKVTFINLSIEKSTCQTM